MVIGVMTMAACGHQSASNHTVEELPQSTTESAVFLMASLDITDFDAFMGGYGVKAPPTVLDAGGVVWAATPTVNVQEGEYTPNWTVLIRFPSSTAAQAWYNSPTYQDAIPLRQAVTDSETSRLLFAPVFESASETTPIEGAAYMFASLKVTDFEALMNDYGVAAGPTVMAAGGEVIIATPEVTLLEGSYAPNWTVVIRFPSEASAQQWYASADYQAAIPKRHAITDQAQSWLMFVPSFSPQ